MIKILVAESGEELSRLNSQYGDADKSSTKTIIATIDSIDIAALKAENNEDFLNKKAPIPSELKLHPGSYQVEMNKMVSNLSLTEFCFLTYLIENRDRYIPRDELIDIAQSDKISPRAIDAHIKNIRKKLRDISPTTEYIKTMRSVGYMFIG